MTKYRCNMVKLKLLWTLFIEYVISQRIEFKSLFEILNCLWLIISVYKK